MDSLWWVLPPMIVTTIFLFKILSSSTAQTSVPRGNACWPIVGETIEFFYYAYSDRPETFMDKRRSKYGNVFKSHLYGNRTIVSTDAEVSKAILQDRSESFVPYFPKSITDLMGKSSILLVSGRTHTRIHGVVGIFFKSPTFKDQVTKDVLRYLRESMNKWQENNVVYLQEETKRIAFEVLVKSLMSLDPGDEMDLLRTLFLEFDSGLISLPLNFPGTQFYRSLKAKKEMIKLVLKIIESRRKNGVVSTSVDVIDAFLKAEDNFSDDLIANNVIDMIIPGEDSVPVLMTLAVKYLSETPSALRQAIEENTKLKMDRARKNMTMNYLDYSSNCLPFTHKVITETLRLGSIISALLRRAVKDVEIKGYLIPRGWCVMTYFRSVHLDDHSFRDPYKFDPWRWTDPETSNMNFTAFGGGPRLCPGAELARLESAIFLHQFLTQFTWHMEEDSIVNFPTVRMKKGLPIRVNRKQL